MHEAYKITENLNSKIFETKNGRLIMQSKCAECGFKKLRFVKEQEAKSLLSNVGIKTSWVKLHCGSFYQKAYKNESICQVFIYCR